MAGRIRVGTASWADPEFVRDWYPPDVAPRDRLTWYAKHFDYVEVNSTFYGAPVEKQTTTWVEQTPPGFTFDIKLHKYLSRHSAAIDTLPPHLRKFASGSDKRVALTPELEQALVEEYLKTTSPLADAGKLGAFLLQLSPEFGPRKHHLDELDHLVELLNGRKFALEFRNRNWVEGDLIPRTLEYCEDRGICLVMVDAPKVEHFMVMPEFEVVTSPAIAYLRLHGRDSKAYLSGRTVAERFNYDYSTTELREVADKASRLADDADEVHIVFNNNHSNLAPKAAEEFQHLIPASLFQPQPAVAA
jgi:uncharacterized protein YecE (DUF72 family)